MVLGQACHQEQVLVSCQPVAEQMVSELFGSSRVFIQRVGAAEGRVASERRFPRQGLCGFQPWRLRELPWEARSDCPLHSNPRSQPLYLNPHPTGVQLDQLEQRTILKTVP